MTEIVKAQEVAPFLEAIGLDEEPMGMFYTDQEPEEGISLSFQAKCPGSKLCIKSLTMHFAYQDVFRSRMPEAYQRLLLDCMQGDQTLFTRQDDVEVAWQLVTPVLSHWHERSDSPWTYSAGAASFPQSDALIQADGYQWRPLAPPANPPATQ